MPQFLFISFFHQYILQPSKAQSKAVLRSVEMCPLFSRHCNKMLDSPSIFICNANFIAVIFNRQRYNQNHSNPHFPVEFLKISIRCRRVTYLRKSILLSLIISMRFLNSTFFVHCVDILRINIVILIIIMKKELSIWQI